MSNWGNPGGHDSSQPSGPENTYPSHYDMPPQSNAAGGYPNSSTGPVPGYGPPGHYFPAQSAKPGVMSLRPQNVGDILDVAFSTIKANPGATFGVSILTGLVSLVLTVAMVALTGGALVGNDPESSHAFGAMAVLTLIVFVPLMALLSIASMCALIHIFSQAVLGHRASIGESMRVGFKRMWSALGATLLLGLAFTVAFVVMIVVLALLAAANTHVAVILLLAFAAILAMLFFSARFAFTLHAIVMESAGPATSIGRSVRLTRKRSWRTFGVLLLAMVVVSIVSSVVQMIGGAISGVAVGTSGGTFGETTDGASTAAIIGATIITGFLGMLVGAFTQPFMMNVAGALYLDARFRDEGLASALAAQSASQPSAPDQPWQQGPPQYGSPYYG